MKIAHVINPVKVGPNSDLSIAQPITFETMRRSQALASGQVEVDLFSTNFPEDDAVAPAGFTYLPHLDRSILDLDTFQKQRKLPLIQDILDRLYDVSDADYFIYTNVDIALKPHFYQTVAELLKQHDALVINRRTIPDTYNTIEQIPLMWAQLGKHHGGFDCFVFKRDAYPRFRLGNVCIGARGIGVAIYANMAAYAENLLLLEEPDLTFHIGNDMVWTKAELNEFEHYNLREINDAMLALREEAGPLDFSTGHGRFLLDRYHRARHHYLRTCLAKDNREDVLKIIPRRPRQSKLRKVANLFISMTGV